MAVICSRFGFAVLKQTHQCALQTWGLLCAGGSPKPEDAPHPHVQLHKVKTEPISVPACSHHHHKPHGTYRCHVRPSGDRAGSLCSRRLGWLQSPPAAVRSQPSSGQCWFPCSWAASGVVAVSSAFVLFPGHPHRLPALGYGMWRFGQQPKTTDGGNWIKSECWHRHSCTSGELSLEQDFHSSLVFVTSWVPGQQAACRPMGVTFHTQNTGVCPV